MRIIELEDELRKQLELILPTIHYMRMGGAEKGGEKLKGWRGKPSVNIHWPKADGPLTRAERSAIGDLINEFLCPVSEVIHDYREFTFGGPCYGFQLEIIQGIPPVR